MEQASQRVRLLLDITRGRAFCLFTSYALMNQLYERLLGELNFPMLLQGSAPKNALLEEFRLTPNAVLFATPPVLLLPQAVEFLYLTTDAEFVHLNSARIAFQPRAPPIS